MSRLKILFLITEDWYFWSHRLSLARAIRDAGHDVIVATKSGSLREQIEAEGFCFRPIRMRRKSRNPWSELLALIDLVILYRSTRPDLLHHVAMQPVLYGSLANKLSRGPAVVNAVTGLGYVFIGSGWKQRLLQRAVELAYRVLLTGKQSIAIFQNPDDLDLFIARHLANDTQTALIYGSGVDTARFAPKPELPGEPVILVPTRMLWDKGVGDLVAAGKILKQRHVPGRIVLAGMLDPGNPTAIPEAQLRAWQEEGLAEWIGYQADMPAILAKAHIVCLPSYREGLPLALIEGASCGKPIVTTNTPGCREIVRDGWNGFLAPVKDHVALADALEQLLTDAGLRQTMGQRSREWVIERFSKETVIKETFAVYKRLLGDQWATYSN